MVGERPGPGKVRVCPCESSESCESLTRAAKSRPTGASVCPLVKSI